jgi:hypothetical protein
VRRQIDLDLRRQLRRRERLAQVVLGVWLALVVVGGDGDVHASADARHQAMRAVVASQ